MKRTNKALLTVVFLMMFGFILSSCSEPYDPAVVPETEVFSPIDIEDTVVTETYNMFKIRFTDTYDIGVNIDTDNSYFLNTYRTYRVTEKELANHNKLFAIFASIKDDEIKQTWAYEQIDEPTDYYDGRVYYLETEQVEQMARELFGKDVNLTHEWPLAPDDTILPSFNNGRYEWRDPNRGGEIPICWFCVPASAEKSENYLVIYDKYFNAKIINRESALFYGDSEFVNSIEIPDEYKPNEFNSLELINFDKYDETVLNFGAPYKHIFKLAEDGTYFWVSSEPVEKNEPIKDPEKTESADSDPIREQRTLTDIAVDENLRAAYDAICNFEPCRRTNYKDSEFSVYRPSKITFEDLDSSYYLMLAYAILPEREREIIIEDAGVYSQHGYLPKKDEFITEDIEYTVYTADELEEAVKKLFGENVNVNHETFYSADALCKGLVYNEKKYLAYYTGSSLGEQGYSDFSVVLKAETDGEYVYVTDKFASFDYSTNENGYMIVDSIYRDTSQSDLICSGDDIPYGYRLPDPDEYYWPANDLFWSDSFDFEVFGDLMQTYKHTFKLAEDGTYFWVSSEPIEE